MQKDRCTEVIQFRENFVWFPANTCDVVCEEDLKHFHTSLLGNEEDANGLLNIKQEFSSHYLLHLIVARMWQVVSLEKRMSGNEWLSAILIPLYYVIQANAFGSRKLQRWRLESFIYFSSLDKIVL